MQYKIERDGVTQSILTGFMKCRQYSKLSLEGWSSLYSSPALSFGEIAHEVLSCVYDDLRTDKLDAYPGDPDEFKPLLNKYLDAAVEKYLNSRGDRLGSTETQTIEDHADILAGLLPEYFKFWKKRDQNKKWISLESEFKVNVADTLVKGKFDGMFDSGGPWLLETKTKSRIDEDTIVDVLHFDFQVQTYLLAMKILLKKQPKGVLYNILRRPQLRRKKHESQKAFSLRVHKDVQSRTSYYFLRYEIAVLKSDMDKFRAELEGLLGEFKSWRAGKLPTFHNTSSCVDRFGPCRFLPICASGNYHNFYKRKHVSPELSKPVEV